MSDIKIGDVVTGYVPCRVCGGATIEIEEEVDIGVGTQKFLIAIECENCGVFYACNDCGIIADGKEKHREWCETNRDLA